MAPGGPELLARWEAGDRPAFEFYLANQARRGQGLADETVQKRLAWLKVAIRGHGFDPFAFKASQDAAYNEAVRYFGNRRSGPHKLSADSFNNHLCVIRDLGRFYNVGARVLTEIPYRPAPPSAPRPLEDGGMERIMQFTHPNPEIHRRCRAIGHILRYTGLRPGEQLRLKRSNFDFSSPKHVILWVKDPGKGGVARPLYLPPAFASPRRPLMAWFKAAPVWAEDPDLLWTTSQPGGGYKAGQVRPLGYAAFRESFTMMAERMGVRANNTIARHTFMTRLSDAGVNVQDIQALVGHRNIASTMRYTRVRTKTVYDRVSKLVKGDLYAGGSRKAPQEGEDAAED